MSISPKLPPTYDELDYEQKVNYKLKIFETILPPTCLNTYPDDVIDQVLINVDHIYEELTKNK